MYFNRASPQAVSTVTGRILAASCYPCSATCVHMHAGSRDQTTNQVGCQQRMKRTRITQVMQG
jgi:hypothetical protein